jgi:dolichol-phosphate mannosyltransferase
MRFVGALGAPAKGSAQLPIAVIIPAFNEAGNIGPLIEETAAAIPSGVLQELIVVDDASDDGTAAEIKALLQRYPPLRYLRHGERAGQSAALRSGIHAATAPIVAALDGDGQNDPADIMRLLARLGAEGEPAMAAGLREGRKAKGSRKAASRFANWIRDKVLDDGCPDTGCGLKLFHRDAYLALPYFDGMHRYLPALFQTYGHRVVYERVNDRPRLRGETKYTNLGRALIGLPDLIGVRWLRKRTVLPPIAEDVSGAEAEETAQGGARRAGARAS